MNTYHVRFNYGDGLEEQVRTFKTTGPGHAQAACLKEYPGADVIEIWREGRYGQGVTVYQPASAVKIKPLPEPEPETNKSNSHFSRVFEEVDPMTTEQFLERLDGVKQSGKGWKAFCPAHEDRNASLSVAEGTNGRILCNCFAGCTKKPSSLRLIDHERLVQRVARSTQAHVQKRKKPASKPIDWPKCVAAFTDDWVSGSLSGVGYRPEFLQELKAKKKSVFTMIWFVSQFESNGKLSASIAGERQR